MSRTFSTDPFRVQVNRSVLDVPEGQLPYHVLPKQSSVRVPWYKKPPGYARDFHRWSMQETAESRNSVHSRYKQLVKLVNGDRKILAVSDL